MKANLKINEVRIDEVRIEGIDVSTEYAPEEMISVIKTVGDFLGKDGVKTILEIFLKNEEQQRRERKEERELERERIRTRSRKI